MPLCLNLLRGSDRFDISLERRQAPRPLDSSARTAIIIPVYNEDAQRVFGGLKATYRSLERAGALEAFDFYVLSDSNDPDRWVDEEVCWARLCRELDAFGRIFYRHRRINLKRKTGNVADFCRRWGANYRYMVVFDADSIMSGPALARAIGVMEQHPDVGILQTVPMPVNGESLLARIQQFASRVYGPVFSAGLNFWQLGDGHYWGHNCVIRVAP